MNFLRNAIPLIRDALVLRTFGTIQNVLKPVLPTSACAAAPGILANLCRNSSIGGRSVTTLSHNAIRCCHLPSSSRLTLLKVPPTGVQSIRTYKVRVVLKKRCSACFFVKRHGRLFVECKAHPRHKQMQKVHARYLYKDDYSKGKIHEAIYWKFQTDRWHWLGKKHYAKHDFLGDRLGREV